MRLVSLGAIAMVALILAPRARGESLSAADVQRIIGQAVAEARAVGVPVSIAVLDPEGNVLGTLRMEGAPELTVLGRAIETRQGLDGERVPAMFAAISKAGTAAFFSTQGNAFSTRTAAFIIQPHFPPHVQNAPSGPLFGVQFSQLPCGDVIPPLGQALPLGLSGDPGGLPLYKRGRAVGGVGVEGNGRYVVDRDPTDREVPHEERIAVAATRGYRAPRAIRGDAIVVGGLRFPFANLEDTAPRRPAPLVPSPGDVPPRDAPPTRFVKDVLGGVRGTYDPRYFPPRDSTEPGGLQASEVRRLLAQGARQANRTRAAIRRPLGDRARVNIAVVDRGGNLLGLFRTKDAPIFGFDVSVQKARAAAFFSSSSAAERLRAEGEARLARGFPDGDQLTPFVEAAARDGIGLRGSIAFSNRAIGFLARPFFPDGIDGTRHGPFSRPIADFTVFNNGIQVELVKEALFDVLSGTSPPDCTRIPGLGNGIQIFPGSVPLYRGRVLVGAIGVSGDGVDQDDIVAAAGSRGFEAPRAMRADRVRVRGVRLPYVKFPRRPTTR